MDRQVVKLSDFDPDPMIEYAITSVDLTNVYHYLRAMQAEIWPGSWEDIALGSYYGASALLHEVVETRILLDRDPVLLTRSRLEIKKFARGTENVDAHLRGLEAEYRYLQRTIQRLFRYRVDIGALLKANTQRIGDWHDLFETGLPFLKPSSGDIRQAKQLLERLKLVGKGKR